MCTVKAHIRKGRKVRSHTRKTKEKSLSKYTSSGKSETAAERWDRTHPGFHDTRYPPKSQRK